MDLEWGRFMQGQAVITNPLVEVGMTWRKINDKFGGTLFRYLVSKVKGEGNDLVRRLADTAEGGQSGFMGMAVLGWRYAPKDGVRTLKEVPEVVNPSKIQDMKVLRRGILEWELAVTKLRTDFGEELSQTMKVVGFMQLLPDNM